ncbi:hypothetical protein C8R43DRAFT_1104910 [Mycena crocata]|nr:hypothetical protein C8R43DRAFT_1104910 [Mycena crocata]
MSTAQFQLYLGSQIRVAQSEGHDLILRAIDTFVIGDFRKILLVLGSVTDALVGGLPCTPRIHWAAPRSIAPTIMWGGISMGRQQHRGESDSYHCQSAIPATSSLAPSSFQEFAPARNPDVKFNLQPHLSDDSIGLYPTVTPSYPCSSQANDGAVIQYGTCLDVEGPPSSSLTFANYWNDWVEGLPDLDSTLRDEKFISNFNEPQDDLPSVRGLDPPPSGNLTVKIDAGAPPNRSSSRRVTKHTCSLCGKDFTRPCSLETHMNIHYNRKPFICPVVECQKAFSVKSNVLRHMRTHGTVAISPPIINSSASTYTVHFAPIETAESYAYGK